MLLQKVVPNYCVTNQFGHCMILEILMEVANKSQIQITYATDFGFKGRISHICSKFHTFIVQTMLFCKIFTNITICTAGVNQSMSIYVVNTNRCKCMLRKS